MLIDTHCHIHSADYPLPVTEVLARAGQAGVERLICVGTDEADSQQAVDFAATHNDCRAAVGLHPHEAKDFTAKASMLPQLATRSKVVAIGECGLDYWYEHSPRAAQKQAFSFQLDLAAQHQLPSIFHIRGSRDDPNDAFADFFALFDEKKMKNPGLTGVVHSFSAGQDQLTGVLSRGLHVGLNGIMTFTGDERQLAAARAVPLERLVLETDAPFLTPSPKRGTINEPQHLVLTAEFLARLRGESLKQLSSATTANANQLFNL